MVPEVRHGSAIEELLASPIPERLWHYTSFEGAKGITESKTIRASDVRFLNDSEELVHAKRLLIEIAEEERDSIEALSPALQLVIKREVDLLFGSWLSPNSLQVFVACFSESADHLNQWRGYSRGTSGISLGFDVRAIRDTFSRPLTGFAPCIYDEAQKKHLLRESVLSLFEAAALLPRAAWNAASDAIRMGNSSETAFNEWFSTDEKIRVYEEQLDKGRMRATFNLLRIAALMKHAAFAEEREWRLVVPLVKSFNDSNTRINFGFGRTSFRPMIDYELDWDRVLVSEVIVGPGSHSSSEDAARQFFDVHGHSPLIRRSSAPYRPD